MNSESVTHPRAPTRARASSKRGQCAASNAIGYSVRVVEPGIRRAIGAVMPANGVPVTVGDVLNTIALNTPEFFGLRRLPDKDTVRRVLKKVAFETQSFLLSVDPSLGGREHPAITILKEKTTCPHPQN